MPPLPTDPGPWPGTQHWPGENQVAGVGCHLIDASSFTPFLSLHLFLLLRPCKRSCSGTGTRLVPDWYRCHLLITFRVFLMFWHWYQSGTRLVPDWYQCHLLMTFRVFLSFWHWCQSGTRLAPVSFVDYIRNVSHVLALVPDWYQTGTSAIC